MQQQLTLPQQINRLNNKYKRTKQTQKLFKAFAPQTNQNKKGLALPSLSQLFPYLSHKNIIQKSINQSLIGRSIVNYQDKEIKQSFYDNQSKLIQENLEQKSQEDRQSQKNKQKIAQQQIQTQQTQQKRDKDQQNENINNIKQSVALLANHFSIIQQQGYELSSNNDETSFEISRLPYKVLPQGQYNPKIQPLDQIKRIFDAIQTYGSSDIKTDKRYELMHDHYKNNGGNKSYSQFQSKIIQDLMFIARKFTSKPQYQRR